MEDWVIFTRNDTREIKSFDDERAAFQFMVATDAKGIVRKDCLRP
jgi:hypothetical protein